MFVEAARLSDLRAGQPGGWGPARRVAPGPADLDHALAGLERSEGTAVRTIVGINEDGVFGTRRENWRPDLPDACRELFIPLLWVKVHELLGRVPAGSTAQFVQDGTLPGEAQGGATIYRMAS
jgi:hypothetical protein